MNPNAILPARWHMPHWRILCYHGVPDGCTDNFNDQLKCMSDLGFHFVSLSEGLKQLNGRALSERMVTLTFDDVEATTFTNAIPILNRLHIQATLYIIADFVRTRSCYRTSGKPPAISIEQVREAIKMGHEVGSHTLTHAPLRYCSRERAQQELVTSKEVLELWCQVKVKHFSYPWGQHSSGTRKLIVETGLYDSAATIERGRMFAAQDPFSLKRDSVCPHLMSPSAMVRIMKLADHWYWVARLMRIFKKRTWRNVERWERLTDPQMAECCEPPEPKTREADLS